MTRPLSCILVAAKLSLRCGGGGGGEEEEEDFFFSGMCQTGP
jgi:hypothetical protein